MDLMSWIRNKTASNTQTLTQSVIWIRKLFVGVIMITPGIWFFFTTTSICVCRYFLVIGIDLVNAGNAFVGSFSVFPIHSSYSLYAGAHLHPFTINRIIHIYRLDVQVFFLSLYPQNKLINVNLKVIFPIERFWTFW